MLKNYVRQILTSLAKVHDQGIVHADLKLGNLLLHKGETGSEVKLADFGISQI